MLDVVGCEQQARDLDPAGRQHELVRPHLEPVAANVRTSRRARPGAVGRRDSRVTLARISTRTLAEAASAWR